MTWTMARLQKADLLGAGYSALSPRELALVTRLAETGASNKQLAKEFNIALSTVKCHFHTIGLKLGGIGGCRRGHIIVLYYRNRGIPEVKITPKEVK